jgi:hypothetical protein
VKALALSIALAAGCSWSQFSDLSNSTWVHGQEAPDSDQSDYAVGIVNVAGADSPGELAVLSGAPANYSTLSFDATGSTNETLTETLGNFSISTLSTHPVFIGDDAGNVAMVDKGVDGTLVTVHGTSGQLTYSQLSSTDPADAATYATTATSAPIIVTSAGSTPTSAKPNAWLVESTVTNCALVEDGMPMAAAALASDGTTVWAYTRTGDLVGYTIAALTTGCIDSQSPPPLSGTTIAKTGVPAANGGYLALVGTQFAIAVAYDSASTSTGMVSVVDLTNMTVVGAPLPMSGVQSAAFGTFGTMPALALGFPSRTVGTTTDVGQVELHVVDTTTGAIDGDVAELLDIPQADGNLVFGRALAAMTYNGATILAVAASNEVYAYYETMLYSDTRQQ